MKLIKLAIKLLVILVVLSILAVVGLLMTFNPNDYKPQIIQAVKDQTGRTLSIEGDIGLSFFPRLGFSVGKTELSNADGFQSRVFAEVDEIDVGLQIKPLFMGKVELDQLVLSGMAANLEINADGSTNWDDLSQPEEVAAKSEQTENSQEDTASSVDTELPPIRFQGIRINDAQVSYTDKVGGTSVIMENFNFSTGVVELWKPIDFEGDFQIENKYPQLNAKLNYSGTLIAKVLENQFGLKNFKLALDAAGEPIPNGKIVVNMGADISANTAEEVAELEQLSIQFDDTTISGSAKVNGFTSPAVQFAVNIDQLNADRYIPQAEPIAESEAGAAPEDAGVAATSSDADTLIELPMQTLRDLNMDGEFTVGQFQVMNLKTQNFKAVMSAHKGIVELKPLGIEMYEGAFDGTVKLDVRKDTPRYGMNAKLTGLQAEPFLMDLMDVDVVAGVAAFDMQMGAQGKSVNTLKRGMNGRFSAVFDKGVLKGNLVSGFEGYFTKLKEGAASLQGLSALAGKDELSSKLAGFQDSKVFDRLKGGETTEFDALKVSGNIVKGVIHSKDLELQSSDIQAQGKGSFDIVTEYLDMGLDVAFDGASCTIPLKGKVQDINYEKFAKKAIPNCAEDAVKEYVGNAKTRLKTEAKARLDAEKAKLKSELKAREAAEKAKLKAKIEAEKKKAKDKLKNKLKDQFKGLF